MIGALPGRRLWQTAVAVAALGSFAAIGMAYPYFLPFVNSLGVGHPAYQLLNDSNASGMTDCRQWSTSSRNID